MKLGFREPQATMREFVILLVILFGGYAALHLLIPSSSSLSLFKIKNNKTRSPILEQISLLKDELKNKENTFFSQLNQTTAAKDVSSQSQSPKDAASNQSQSPKDAASNQSQSPKDATTQSQSTKDPTNTQAQSTKDPTITQAQSSKDANTVSGISTSSDKSLPTVKVSNENSLLNPKTIEKWKEDLSKTNISEKEKKYIADLSSDLSALLKQLESKDIKKENLSILFLNINKNLVNLESSLENSLTENLFWTGNGKWLEVIFWSLIGTLLYIIQQTSEYYLSPKSPNASKILTRRKPQYYYFLFQSPFTALVILWILSMANLGIIGITLTLSTAPSEVLISLAFILGFYNRVANTQLNLIVAKIFGDAWKKTVRKIEIKQYEGSDNQNNQPETGGGIPKIIVRYGQCTDFDVLPDVKVEWSIISEPPIGIIDISTGTYIAPPEDYYYKGKTLERIPDDKKDDPNYKRDIIKALREDEDKDGISALALVILEGESENT